jgi:hypothetical protein
MKGKVVRLDDDCIGVGGGGEDGQGGDCGGSTSSSLGGSFGGCAHAFLAALMTTAKNINDRVTMKRAVIQGSLVGFYF